MPEEISELRTEVKGLRREVQLLRQEVQRLQTELERSRTESGPNRVLGSPHRASSSGYSVVTGPPADIWSSAANNAPTGDRRVICDSIAAHLVRSLAGDHRGESGRSRLPIGSKYWLVIRSYEGDEFNPVRVYGQWSSAKVLTKRGDHLGQSVFIGLPSLGDVGRVVESGGFDWDGTVLR